MVPIEDRQLEWFDVPRGYNGDGSDTLRGKYSEVVVKAEFAGGNHKWEGRVVRTEGRIDDVSRMVNIVVEVRNPFELSDHRPALVPGMFVEIEVLGRVLKNVVRVPRHSVHNGSEVWIFLEEALRIEKVEIARRDKQFAYVSSGLEEGDVIVTSPLDTVTDGMKIRIELSEDLGGGN